MHGALFRLLTDCQTHDTVLTPAHRPTRQIKSLRVSDSKYGLCLVVETARRSGGYVLGFRVEPKETLDYVEKEIHSLWQVGQLVVVVGRGRGGQAGLLLDRQRCAWVRYICARWQKGLYLPHLLVDISPTPKHCYTNTQRSTHRNRCLGLSTTPTTCGGTPRRRSSGRRRPRREWRTSPTLQPHAC